MTNKTINDGTDLGTTPASGDFFPIWDLDAGQQKKVSYADLLGATLTGGGTIATGGFTLTVPATGTAALATGISGGQTVYGGTESGNSLTLRSTSHATKGYVYVADSVFKITAGSFQNILLTNTDTDATDKYAGINMMHATSAEEPIAMILGFSDATPAANYVYIGGGQSGLNAATQIQFRTAADTTTLVGTERLSIDSTGLVSIKGDSVQVVTSQTPASGGTGIQGEIAWGNDGGTIYLYVCTATNTWARVALTGGY